MTTDGKLEFIVVDGDTTMALRHEGQEQIVRAFTVKSARHQAKQRFGQGINVVERKAYGSARQAPG